jgi:hypothetical protein
MIKSRMRWAGNIARMGKKRYTLRVVVGKPVGKRRLRRHRRRWRIILNWILDKKNVVRTGLIWLRMGTCGALL